MFNTNLINLCQSRKEKINTKVLIVNNFLIICQFELLFVNLCGLCLIEFRFTYLSILKNWGT